MSDQTSPDTPSDQEGHGTDDADEHLDPEIQDRLNDAATAMDDVRRQLAEAPVEVVVVNHVMGLYELAAIHLSTSPPDIRAAALAIDAVACLVEGLDHRLGPDAPTMRDALANIRLAFVQVKNSTVS